MALSYTPHIISLTEATGVLSSLWGYSVNDRSSSGVLTPDSVVERARAAGFDVQVQEIEDWENRSDSEILEEVTSRIGRLRGELLLVTEASYGPAGGAFRLDATELDDLVREHQDRFEPVFNGDVILAVMQERVVVCVHHENYLFVASPPGRNPPTPPA